MITLYFFLLLTTYDSTNCKQNKVCGNYNSRIKRLHGSVEKSVKKKKQQNLRIFPSIDIKDFSEDVPKLFGDIQKNCGTTFFPVLFLTQELEVAKKHKYLKWLSLSCALKFQNNYVM